MPDDFTRQGRASGWEKIDLRVSSEASFRKLDQKPCIYNTSKFHVWYNNFFTNTLQVTLFLKQSFVARSLTHRRQKLYGIANKLKLTKQPNFEIWWISLQYLNLSLSNTYFIIYAFTSGIHFPMHSFSL